MAKPLSPSSLHAPCALCFFPGTTYSARPSMFPSRSGNDVLHTAGRWITKSIQTGRLARKANKIRAEGCLCAYALEESRAQRLK